MNASFVAKARQVSGIGVVGRKISSAGGGTATVGRGLYFSEIFLRNSDMRVSLAGKS